MNRIQIRIAGAAPLILGALTLWGCLPPEPNPEEIPSHVLEPPSAEYRDAVSEGRAVARALIAEERLPGLSLAVAIDGEIVWAEGFRWADMENRIPVTPETLFRIGGISECITAAAVGLLTERGRLNLDAPVQQYLPDFPEKEWAITTRQLMAHTAGLRPHPGEGEGLRGTSCADDETRLTAFADDPLRFEPGTEILYSTYGWVLVGAVVSAAADEPYLDFVTREILTPLDMQHTLPDTNGPAGDARASFYYPRIALNPRYGVHDAATVDLSCILPGGGFLSTPSDLARFGAAMMGDALLDPVTVGELLSPVQLKAGGSTDQALGWTVGSVRMGPEQTPTTVVGRGLGDTVRRRPLSAVAVGGHAFGATASLLLIPEHGITIAVAANVSGADNVSVLSIRIAEGFVGALEAP